jgi:glucokinase
VRPRGVLGAVRERGALVLEAQELAKAAPALAADMLQLAGGEPEMITGPVVTEAARTGDVAALKCFDLIGTWLGRGMAPPTSRATAGDRQA